MCASTPCTCRIGLLEVLGVVLLLTPLIASCRPTQPPAERVGRVVEASMVPHLYGKHCLVRCRRCHAKYRIQLAPSIGDTRSACSHCGCLQQPERVGVQTGDRLLIEASEGPFQRWQTAVFRHPQRLTKTCIKRVVGLPGEQVDIRDGEFLINGLPYQKTFAEYQALAVNVVDTRSSELHVDDACWERDDYDWTVTDQGLEVTSDNPPHVAWLRFRGRPFPGYDMTRGIVFDDYNFNQQVSRRLHPMRDVTVAVEAACHSPSVELHIHMVWEAETGDDSWSLVVSPNSGQAFIRRHDVLVETISLPRQVGLKTFSVAFGCVDGQILVTHGIQELWRWSSDEMLPTRPLLSLKVGVRDVGGKGLTVKRLMVARDIFYLGSMGLAASTHLDTDEVYVLGDNCPVSEDSRQFGPLNVARMVGLAVHASSSSP